MTRFRARCALCDWVIVTANPEAREAEFNRHYLTSHKGDQQ